MDLIGMTINLATSTEDMEIIEDVEAYCDELVKLFGGNGVKLTIETGLQVLSLTVRNLCIKRSINRVIPQQSWIHWPRRTSLGW